MSWRSTALCLAWLLPAAAWADTALRFEGGLGYDSNARREPSSGAVRGDSYLGLLAVGELDLGGQKQRLSGSVSEGVKLFATEKQQTLIASRLELGYEARPLRWTRLGAEALAIDLTQAAGERDYDLLRAVPFAEAALGRFALRLGGGWQGLLFRAYGESPFSSQGPVGAALLRFSPVRAHDLCAQAEIWQHAYPSGAGRQDQLRSFGASYAFRGPVLASLSYLASFNRSSVEGQGFTRHRVILRGAAELPWETTLALQGSLQTSLYPQGLYLADELFLSDADQSQNALELKLSRSLGGVDLGIKYAFYGNEFRGALESSPDLRFSRHLLQLSVSWRSDE